MSKRYYIAAVIGDGGETNPYRPAVAEHGVNWAGAIPIDMDETGADYGKPLYANCLCIVSAQDHSALLNDSRIYALPDFPLDGKVSGIATTTRNAMIAALKTRGFSTSGIDNTDGYREVLQLIGVQRDPDFNLNAFDVAE